MTANNRQHSLQSKEDFPKTLVFGLQYIQLHYYMDWGLKFQQISIHQFLNRTIQLDVKMRSLRRTFCRQTH